MNARLTFKSVMDGDTWRTRPYLLLETPTGLFEAPVSGITPRRQKLYDIAAAIVGAMPLPLSAAIPRLAEFGMQPAHIAELFGSPPPCGEGSGVGEFYPAPTADTAHA